MKLTASAKLDIYCWKQHIFSKSNVLYRTVWYTFEVVKTKSINVLRFRHASTTSARNVSTQMVRMTRSSKLFAKFKTWCYSEKLIITSISTSYVLLHHEIGELDGEKGCWGFAEGGMGSVSMAIAKSAKSHGADLFVNAVCWSCIF